MTSTIQETVTNSLREQGLTGYAQQAQRVVDVLVRREKEISDKLLEAAVGQDMDEDEVRGFMREAGMEMSQSAATNGETGADPDRLASLERQVAALTEFARRNGYRQ